ncbi:hypothetical protein BJ170DRAFT_723264 [Xylariales sp. AK1849]|nr:hypothetical protein BJ170DRAFT_723264 [Xylariales sp. AK1849]
MPSFGRIGKQSNRSQHNLVEQQHQTAQAHAPPPLSALATASSSSGAVGPGSAITPPSASSAGLSSSESFQVDTRAAAQQQHSQLQPQQALHSQQQQRLPENQRPLAQQQHQQHQHQQPPPPLTQQQQLGQPQIFGGNVPNNTSSGTLTSNHPTSNHNVDSAAAAQAYDNSRQQKSQHPDFADLVSRSQSTRYPQVSPLQTHQQFGPASSSADDLPQTISSSPLLPQGQPIGPNHQQQQQQHHHHHHQAPPTSTETKPSTRKLIKKILQGASVTRVAASSSASSPSDLHHHQPHHSYDNTAGLARRPSKRVSNPFPPTIRTGTSQVSLEQHQHPDWQQSPPQSQQQGQHTLASPLQGLGEVDESYAKEGSNQDPRPHPHQNTIRRVAPTDVDTSPYSPQDHAFQQAQAQAQLQAQLQVQAEQQKQQRYGQVVIDPAQEEYHYNHSQSQGPYQQGNPPQLYTGHLASQQPNPETVSQLSHESPVTDSDQRSIHLQSIQTSPGVDYSQQDLAAQQNQLPVSPVPSIAPPVNMVPPPGGPGSTRRAGDNDKAMRGSNNIEPPPGPPPNYRHSQAPLNSMNSLPPTPGIVGGNRDFRASNVPERQAQQFSENAGPEGGRHSPQPSTGGERDSDPDKQFKDLLTKYKNVKRLYFDGKTQIEQLSGQVEQLQNAVANQRISQSRTALDDNEYTTRFNRLNGAINNLSFNIRKDWRTLPPWIDRYVSVDALKTGKQEMTAAGRAVIMRWVVDEIFNKCFHPGLEKVLSQQLKEIEQNIRRFSYTLTSQEEQEALTSKVVSWRMATLEGLQHVLQSPENADNRQIYTTLSSGNLTAHLYQYLVDPPPTGVEGSVAMIVELAVGIAANLCLESRDVAIVYPLPGESINADFMELEKAGLPPLPDPEEAEDSGKDADKASKRDKTKSGMLTMLGGAPPPSSSRKSSIVSNTDATDSAATPPKDPTKVRFAGFVSVEVRGRQVLVKAPVWNLG